MSIHFDDDFLSWWERHIIAIDDYLYGRLDFSHDPDMVVPPGSALGEIGKDFYKISFFYVLFI